MWRLMSRSVDTCLLIALKSSRYYWMHAWVFVFTWDIDVLIMLIVHLTLLSIVTLILPGFVLITSHV